MLLWVVQTLYCVGSPDNRAGEIQYGTVMCCEKSDCAC